MLFDLKGRRRRVIQVTYLMLAVLMGGGLVLFGIGGDVQGGLVDAFTGENENSSANPIVEKRLKEAEARLKANPKDQEALKDLTRSRFQLAGNDVNPDTGLYGPKARPELERASDAWERYLATNPSPADAGLARVMLQVYGEFGINRPDKASEAADIVAQADPNSSTFLALSRYAAMAGQERQSKLAGKRAIALAPKEQRRIVKKQVDQIEKAAAQQKAATAGGAAGGSAPGGGGSAPGLGGAGGGTGR